MTYVIIPNIHFIGSKAEIEEFLEFRLKVGDINRYRSYEFLHLDKSLRIDVSSKVALKTIQKAFMKQFGHSITMVYHTRRGESYYYETD